MGYNTVFDPSLLFISKDDWLDLDYRDSFLAHLLDNLSYIDDYNITKIYWTYELEECLWSDPQLPPWRKDIDWKLKIVPIIYKRFSDRRILLDDFNEVVTCRMKPGFKKVCEKDSIQECFLRILHFVLIRNEQVFLCLAIENRIDESIYCYCDCHEYKFKPILISAPDEWLSVIDLEKDYWPTVVNNDEIERFRMSINIMARIKFGKHSYDGFIYEYEFSHKFIKSICEEKQHRKQVLNSITKRLLTAQKDASSDGGLSDEPVRGQKEIRRFRVTGENRIHYKYKGAKRIVFLDYYREGQHDNGL